MRATPPNNPHEMAELSLDQYRVYLDNIREKINRELPALQTAVDLAKDFVEQAAARKRKLEDDLLKLDAGSPQSLI